MYEKNKNNEVVKYILQNYKIKNENDIVMSDLREILILLNLYHQMIYLAYHRFVLENVNTKMIEEITSLVNQMKSNLALEINKSMVSAYRNIGRIIVCHENENNNRLEYEKEILVEKRLIFYSMPK
ncbi:MAG: DUF1016 domain-containing protein [Bacilli bacterium]|nr:DUF1016 domain-containing protein [Bacilli bacterium]